MTTIKEIAKACNVSVATVSNIINNKGGVGEKTKKRVRAAIEEMNYTPNHVAKNLKMKHTRSIGVIAEDMTVFSLPDIIDGITEYCEAEEYQILLINLRLYKKFADTYYREDRHVDIVQCEIQKLLAKQVDGIIYVAAHERVINFMPDDLPIPVVVAYGYAENTEIPSVVVDDVSGSYEMAKYLISCGHKKIGLIAGRKDSIHTQARLEGYQKALFDHGLLFDPTLVLYGNWERKNGYENTDLLINKGVTAIFSMNDIMASGVYDRLEELGVEIGRDIAVAGYDNREISGYMKPQLTTIGLPLHDIGYYASEIILKLLRKEEFELKDGIHFVKCNPFIRKSVNKVKPSSEGEDESEG
ncbi:MAG: LacI family DNA-binding transcriptional regulator [Lachnospiraceae bacterium]